MWWARRDGPAGPTTRPRSRAGDCCATSASCGCWRPNGYSAVSVCSALAVLVFVFRKSKGDLRASFNTDLPLLRPLADQIGWNVDDSKIVRGINDVFSLSETTLTWIAVGLIVYAALQFVEGTGCG